MQVRDESKYIKFIHLIWFFKINWENKLICKVMSIVLYILAKLCTQLILTLIPMISLGKKKKKLQNST